MTLRDKKNYKKANKQYLKHPDTYADNYDQLTALIQRGINNLNAPKSKPARKKHYRGNQLIHLWATLLTGNATRGKVIETRDGTKLFHAKNGQVWRLENAVKRGLVRAR